VSISRSISKPIARPISSGISSEYGGGVALPAYNPAFWLNNLGLSNQAAASTRTSTATAFDHEGVLVTGEAGEIMLDGGRREQNLLPNSSDFTNAAWNARDCTVGTKDVDGFNEVTNDVTNDSHGVYDITAAIVGHRYVVEAKAGTAGYLLLTSHGSSVPGQRGTFFDLLAGEIGEIGTIGQNPTIESLGDGVYRCSIDEGDSPSGIFSVLVAETDGVDKYAGTGKSIHIRSPMVVNVAGRSNKLPPEFLDSDTDYGYGVNGVKWYSTTNGNTESGGVVTSAPGVAISPVPQVLMQPQRTNHLTYSRDLTNAAWVKTGVTAALDATGVDGVSSSASTLTATAANGTAFNAVTLVSADYVASAYVKRKTGIGTIELTDDGGITYTDITSLINSSMYSLVQIATTQANPSIGFRLVASGDEIEVDATQLEEGLVATTPIQTTTAPVTRDNDLIEVDGFDLWANASEGVAIFEVAPSDDWGSSGAANYLSPVSPDSFGYRNSAQDGIVITVGGKVVTALDGNAVGARTLVASVWSAILAKASVGYTYDDGVTWHWGEVAGFTALSTATYIKIGATIAEFYTHNGVVIYPSLPPGATTLTEVQDWIEANAESEIAKKEG